MAKPKPKASVRQPPPPKTAEPPPEPPPERKAAFVAEGSASGTSPAPITPKRPAVAADRSPLPPAAHVEVPEEQPMRVATSAALEQEKGARRTTIYFRPDVFEDLRAACFQRREDISGLVNKAVEHYLKDVKAT